MKFILVDCNNSGILYLSLLPETANQLKFGIIDTDLRVIHPSHVSYQIIQKEDLKTQHYRLTKDRLIQAMPAHLINDVYLNRKQLISLRAPLVEKVMYYVRTITQKTKFTVWDSYENNLELLLNDSNLNQAAMLNEYAHINSITTEFARKEIKILVESIQALKLRVYAQQKRYVDRINLITTAEEAKSLMKEITDTFYKDNLI